ncbi:hypothetical protein [Nostoc sp.]|uniref:hypothetical protein n=1 Tax=Nostoc sp. TaxID=1180 RepID=UPI002FF1C3A8
MTLKYLLDENFAPLYQVKLKRQKRDLVVWVVGDPGTPPKSTLDPEILCWCEEHYFLLVTNNRKSMPVYLAEHIAQDRNIPGIFILNDKLTIGQNINELILIAEASLDNEYQNQILHLPLLQ